MTIPTPAGAGDLAGMQEILAAALPDPSQVAPHPGELVWWIHHADPRRAGTVEYWLWDTDGFLVVDRHDHVVMAFTRPGVDPIPLVDWARMTHGEGASVWFVSRRNDALRNHLRRAGLHPTEPSVLFERDLAPLAADPVPGWDIRPVAGEREADARRRASHAAFASTMDHAAHLERYLTFMRAPGYVPDRDLVAVDDNGTVGAFGVWWGDPSGVAELEPVGTHPDVQRRGLGRMLMAGAIDRMRAAGMTTVRVGTDTDRLAAMAFYRSVGFREVGPVEWWAPAD